MAGVTARTTAELTNVNKNTAYYFHCLRLLIYQHSPHLEIFDGEIEANESYFDGVFGLLKRDGKVYTVVVSNTQSATLLPIIWKKVKPDSIVYTDFYRSYDVLDVSEFNHFRINHSTHFAENHNHINGIENFGAKQNTICVSLTAVPKCILSCI